MIKTVLRILSIIFWISIIFIFLTVPPKFFNLFQSKTLNVFTWSSLLDAKYLTQFERDTGIKINLSYYESNEELLGKLKASNAQGYDLIVPSDYTVDWMIKENMLKKIDTARLSFFDRLDKRLVHNYFDPSNEYSIPYFWGVYGVCINTDYYLGDIPSSFKLLFDQAYVPYKVCMPGNAREVIMMAAFYLFGDVNAVRDPEKREQVKNLLIQQKKWVASYSDERSEYSIMSRTCSAVLTLSPDIWRVKNEYENIKFLIPQEGAFVVIDNFVIPKDTQKDELIYTFLNYLYGDDAIIHHSIKFGMCPPVAVKNVPNDPLLCSIMSDVNRLMFFKSDIPNHVFNEIWMALMAA